MCGVGTLLEAAAALSLYSFVLSALLSHVVLVSLGRRIMQKLQQQRQHAVRVVSRLFSSAAATTTTTAAAVRFVVLFCGVIDPSQSLLTASGEIVKGDSALIATSKRPAVSRCMQDVHVFNVVVLDHVGSKRE